MIQEKLNIKDFILRGRKAGEVNVLLSEYASLISDGNQVNELLSIAQKSGQKLNESEIKVMSLLKKNPQLKEVAMEVQKLNDALTKTEDEEEKAKIEEKINEYNFRLFEVFAFEEEKFDKEAIVKKNDLAFDIVEKFLESKKVDLDVIDELSLTEISEIILNIFTEPENNYDQTNLSSIRSSLRQPRITTTGSELSELTNLEPITEKS